MQRFDVFFSLDFILSGVALFSHFTTLIKNKGNDEEGYDDSSKSDIVEIESNKQFQALNDHKNNCLAMRVMIKPVLHFLADPFDSDSRCLTASSDVQFSVSRIPFDFNGILELRSNFSGILEKFSIVSKHAKRNDSIACVMPLCNLLFTYNSSIVSKEITLVTSALDIILSLKDKVMIMALFKKARKEFKVDF